MRQRQKNIHGLLPDESVILTNQAFIKDSLRSGWKPGHLSLTSRRLVLHQPARNIFTTSLDAILSVATEKKGFILRSVDALSLSYVNSGNEAPSKVWIVVKDPERWQKEIFNRTRLHVSENDIERVASELDPESRSILLHIWEERHATIHDLARLYDAPNHMEVLQRIRKTINPLSERMVGFPILVFERSRMDAVNGEQAKFSWWIIGRRRGGGANGDIIIDAFDEGDRINIFMELLGVKEEEITVNADIKRVIISASGEGRDYYEEVFIDGEIDPEEKISKRYKNGIFQVSLAKKKR